MGLPVLILAVILWFQIGSVAITEAFKGGTLGYIILGILTGLTLSMIPYYASLYQAFKMLTYIDRNKAFSALSVAALKKIKKYALIICGLYILISPLVFAVAQWDDAPGLVIIGMIPAFAALVVSVFAAVLQRLLQEAIELKSENELTV
ncbi:DUF2975 domain-containing protein [Desemzia sp. RIT804]|nr:DUF2975 domain-containing protein [Desemzia sp. RIT 804]MBM6614794.1 DUF2975 domain-containing protein [Desemzia sp. RIT 804]